MDTLILYIGEQELQEAGMTQGHSIAVSAVQTLEPHTVPQHFQGSLSHSGLLTLKSLFIWGKSVRLLTKLKMVS